MKEIFYIKHTPSSHWTIEVMEELPEGSILNLPFWVMNSHHIYLETEGPSEAVFSAMKMFNPVDTTNKYVCWIKCEVPYGGYFPQDAKWEIWDEDLRPKSRLKDIDLSFNRVGYIESNSIQHWDYSDTYPSLYYVMVRGDSKEECLERGKRLITVFYKNDWKNLPTELLEEMGIAE